jgi:hypothetical protein
MSAGSGEYLDVLLDTIAFLAGEAAAMTGQPRIMQLAADIAGEAHRLAAVADRTGTRGQRERHLRVVKDSA